MLINFLLYIYNNLSSVWKKGQTGVVILTPGLWGSNPFWILIVKHGAWWWLPHSRRWGSKKKTHTVRCSPEVGNALLATRHPLITSSYRAPHACPPVYLTAAWGMRLEFQCKSNGVGGGHYSVCHGVLHSPQYSPSSPSIHVFLR